jgi:hypothetical protein
MGLEPTTFCMAIRSCVFRRSKKALQITQFLAGAPTGDARGLPAIHGDLANQWQTVCGELSSTAPSGPRRPKQHGCCCEHGSSDAELPNERQAVEPSPVLDDAAVAQAADRDAPHADTPAAVGPGQHPAVGDAVVLGDLVDDFKDEIVEQCAIELVDWRTPSSPWYSELAK